MPVGAHTGNMTHLPEDKPREEAHTGPGNKLGAIWAGISGTLGTQSMV